MYSDNSLCLLTVGKGHNQDDSQENVEKHKKLRKMALQTNLSIGCF